jgi:isopentenyl-diphosphate delta-isomerase
MGREVKGYSRIKDLHIDICLSNDVESPHTNGLETVGLAGGLPAFALHDIDTSTQFIGKRLSLPLLAAPITGGGRRSAEINRNIAGAAQRCGIAVALGSSRPLLEKKAGPDSYMVRDVAPSVPLFANMGLVHAKRGRQYCLEAVESIGADGLILYVNPLHEILQTEGESDFTGVLEALAGILDDFPYPVFLKEVGCGLQDAIIDWAAQHRVAGIDVAGVGGTNWARIEGLIQGKDYTVFEHLGRCTKLGVIAAAQRLRRGQCLIASGGVRTGVEMAKCLALGGQMTAMALPFLRWAARSEEDVVQGIERLRHELTCAMWFCGCRTINELHGRIEEISPLK